MTSKQIISMAQYYNKKYGAPVNDSDAIKKLTQAYRELFDEIPTKEVKEGIAEYFRILTNRKLPAYLWILESIHVTSKKEKGKRNLNYCIGMLRSWMKNGFGHIPNQEEDELAELFHEITGFEVTVQSRQVLQYLMGQYGLVKTTRMIAQLRGNMDISCLVMNQLKNSMEDKYGEEVTTESVASKAE